MLDDMKATCDENGGRVCEDAQRAKESRKHYTPGDDAWAYLSGALLKKLQSLACSTTVRSKRQFAHDLGDLRNMREVAWAGLVDVLLQLLLHSSWRALRQKGR